MEHEKKGILHISDSDIQLLHLSQLKNITQHQQIMRSYKICIQAGIYQEYLNHWRKRRLIYKKNNTK